MGIGILMGIEELGRLEGKLGRNIMRSEKKRRRRKEERRHNREGEKKRKQKKGRRGNRLQPKLESAPKIVVKLETFTKKREKTSHRWREALS
ncbi:hypothetical protein C1H46_000304 [Malus baccata]|uniref:Uncharacterized protein n=1 Tax=Malus baccata TaxID=106549 RepID=A0A540NTW1_MALBA|nr:hypothetical protein C1H46_000304 [Malus baccata]